MTGILIQLALAGLVLLAVEVYLRMLYHGLTSRELFQQTVARLGGKLPEPVKRRLPQLAQLRLWPFVAVLLFLALLSYRNGEITLSKSVLARVVAIAAGLLWFVRLCARFASEYRCAGCGRWITMSRRSCPFCGMQQKKSLAIHARRQLEVLCPECGVPIPHSDTSCGNCGFSFLGERGASSDQKESGSPGRGLFLFPVWLMFILVRFMMDSSRTGGSQELAVYIGFAAFVAFLWWFFNAVSRPREKDEEDHLPEEFECSDCGATVPRDATICHQCGVSFDEKNKQNTP